MWLINENIAFNADECSLTFTETGDFIQLSLITSRLLEAFIKSGGDILSRDYLLTQVWDNYGLRGGSNNLNQYVSMLRRTLENFGCTGLIITVPRSGFRLDAGIKIEPLPVTDNMPPNHIYQATAKSIRRPSWLIPALRSRTGLAILVLSAGIFLAFTMSFIKDSRAPVEFRLPGGCGVKIIRGFNNLEKPEIVKQMTEVMKENSLSCTPNVDIYFTNHTSLTSKNYGRTLISHCLTNNKGDIISCDNYYYLDWRR